MLILVYKHAHGLMTSLVYLRLRMEMIRVSQNDLHESDNVFTVLAEEKYDRKYNYKEPFTEKLMFRLMVGSLIGAMFIFSIIGLNITIERNRTYNELIEMMDRYHHYDLIVLENKLNELPSHYRDVAQIREEFNYIKQHSRVISAYHRNAHGFYINGRADELRDALLVFDALDEHYENWNFRRIVNSFPMRLRTINTVYTSDTYYFHYFVNPDFAGALLITNLPNPLPGGRAYTMFFEDDVIGFYETFDPEVRYISFEILSVTPESIEVYVYATGETAIMFIEEERGEIVSMQLIN